VEAHTLDGPLPSFPWLLKSMFWAHVHLQPSHGSILFFDPAQHLQRDAMAATHMHIITDADASSSPWGRGSSQQNTLHWEVDRATMKLGEW